MNTPRLRALRVKGFRVFGADEQTLNLPSDLAAVWAPNSKGKTSLAEAVEFLLTGKIVRRELMASSQAEFADALRNVHISATTPVYVSAQLIAADGTAHEIKRTLVSDYAKNEECRSHLEIDGARAGEDALGKLGITLSQPPLGAPVLAQHTLSYIFSVRPQDRATYFKALLEVTDLDHFRSDAAALQDQCAPPNAPLLTKFDTCVGMPALHPILGGLTTAVPDLTGLTQQIANAAQVLIANAGQYVPNTISERIASIETILADRRAKTFPVNDLRQLNLQAWTQPTTATFNSLDTYLTERGKIDAETRRLVAIFDEALNLPAIGTITQPLTCPLCETDKALTPERVATIRAHVANAAAFTEAASAAATALNQLSVSAANLVAAATVITPAYLRQTAPQRRATGFTIQKMRALLATTPDALLRPWLKQLRPLKRAIQRLRKGAEALGRVIDHYASNLETELDPAKLRREFELMETLRSEASAAIIAYNTPAQALLTGLNATIDAKANTAGWQDFLDVAVNLSGLRTLLVEQKARATMAAEFETALSQIDHAKEKVLDDKFSDYSDTILAWWERLRPDEPTFFASVKPRPGARRTIDFKAGLSPHADRSSPKMRDVIAVFSQSQLHCLGLALFLARAETERMGFIVLDDPVLSSDEDYRVHFNATVVDALLNLPMQVIVLTQDNTTWKELETRYRHVSIATAQIFIDSPLTGAIIENTSDELLSKINRAQSLARGGHPNLRKECGVQLRDAGERFCKEMLVQDRHGKGDTHAKLSDYDGKILEWLTPHVDPLLVKDPSHQGKFEVFKNTVNRACHDNAPPGNEEMKMACGEIRYLMKQYLSR